MPWIEDYEKQLDDRLRRAIARDFPLLEKTHVEALAVFLCDDDVSWTIATLDYLHSYLGSDEAIQKFLDLYWPSRAQWYRDGAGHKSRAGTPKYRRRRR